MNVDTAPLKLLRFKDLKDAGVVSNRPQLGRLVNNHGFPRGYLLSPGARVWDAIDVERWLDERRRASAPATDETSDATAH